MDWLTEFVKESLPTIWSRRVAAATATIAMLCWSLPEFLQKIDLHIAGTETLSFRIAVVSTILFLGSLVTLLFVVRAYNNLVFQHAIEIENLMNKKTPMKISQEALDAVSMRNRRLL